MTGYNPKDAEGFINLFALPITVPPITVAPVTVRNDARAKAEVG
jgi:hypothetical protein